MLSLIIDKHDHLVLYVFVGPALEQVPVEDPAVVEGSSVVERGVALLRLKKQTVRAPTFVKSQNDSHFLQFCVK